MNIAGYHLIKLLQKGPTARLYRATQEAKGSSKPASVIIKTLTSEHPTLEDLIQLKHEYAILKAIKLDGILEAIALESYQNGLALILSDFQGEPLTHLIRDRQISLETFLQIAIRLAITLGHLHQHKIIHKDINPDNILVSEKGNEIRIINFNISSALLSEDQPIHNFSLPEGVLSYISPEQTGQMNRLLDYRTGFYSLGITFYEMLTGELPFQTSDSLELVHYHIAQRYP